jgi:hypothetical protein
VRAPEARSGECRRRDALEARTVAGRALPLVERCTRAAMNGALPIDGDAFAFDSLVPAIAFWPAVVFAIGAENGPRRYAVRTLIFAIGALGVR